MNNKLTYSLWLFPLVAISSLGLDIFISGLPQITEAFSGSVQSVQLVISAYVFFLSVGQLVFGSFVDKHGAQKAFRAGIVLCFLGSIGVMATNSLSILIVMRSIQGFGASAVVVATFSSVPKLFEQDLVGKVFSLFSAVLSLVPVIAPVIGSFLSAEYGWQSCFEFMAAYMFLCFIINGFRPLPTHNEKQTLQDGSIKSYAKILKQPNFIVGCMACSLGFSTQLIFFSCSPLVIIEQFGIDTEYFGFYFSIDALAITFGSLVAVKLIGKFKEVDLIKNGAVLLGGASLGYLGHYFSEHLNIWHFIIPASIGSFGFAMLMSAGTTLALKSFVSLSGAAAALNGSIQLIVASVASWLVLSFWGDNWTVLIVIYVACAVAIYLTTISLLTKAEFQHAEGKYRVIETPKSHNG